MHTTSFVLLSVCCCICLAAMDRIALNQTAIDNGAVCLDGSGGIYYFKKAASDENSTKWVLHFLGGGSCSTNEECLNRSKQHLGSSKIGWPEKYEEEGPMSEDPEVNPDFYDWNHVLFAYCDGASFSGDRTEPVQVGNATLYYRGHRILRAVVDDLLAFRGLDKATSVLVFGESAGGRATYAHVDELRSWMPESVTRFKAVPLSTVFLNRTNIEGKLFFIDFVKNIYNTHNCTANAKCIAAQSPDEVHKCFFAEFALSYIETPFFLANSANDALAIFCITLGEPLIGISNGTGNCSAIPGWGHCPMKFDECTPEKWDEMEEYPKAFRSIFDYMPILQQDGNGFYEHSCFNHAIEPDFAWHQLVVNNTLLRDAVGKWYFSDNEPAANHTYRDCINHHGVYCNPTCIPPSPQSSSSSNPSSYSSSSSSVIVYPMATVIGATLLALYHIIF